jgi:hypothetical protein
MLWPVGFLALPENLRIESIFFIFAPCLSILGVFKHFPACHYPPNTIPLK